MKVSLVEALRDQIIRGELVPGQFLRLEEIAAQFDVSTMPVREALRQLESEGMVTVFPHRGAMVTQLSADELQDIYDVRDVLEEMAARLAVPFLTEETLAEMASIIEQIENHTGDVATLVKLNHEFHLTLYAASGRNHLCELIRTLRYRSQHYLHVYTAEVDVGHLPQIPGEHRAIIEACRRGDAEQAAALTREHVAEAGRVIIEDVRRRDASVASANEAG
ncbi:MAG: GntR family transcriptional regulator [Chloroflexota bacterium]